MAVRTLHHLSLCDGYGGWGLTWRELGADVRTVCRVEWEAHAAATLVARMEDQALDQAPVWDDVATFDGRPWRGRVDIVTAGFPCQPFSSAGKRAGVHDERWLWPSIARVLAEVEPGIVILENVPGLRRQGLPEVLSDLAQLGFDAEWGLLSAAAVGAPHKRERFWLVAYTPDCRLEGGRLSAEWWRPVRVADAPRPGDDLSALADAQGVGQREQDDEASPVAWGHPRVYPGWGGCSPHAWPPQPDDIEGWREWIARGGPEPSLRRVPDGATGRLVKPAGLSDRLHLLGNGHVPQCAAEAVRQLVARIVS